VANINELVTVITKDTASFMTLSLGGGLEEGLANSTLMLKSRKALKNLKLLPFTFTKQPSNQTPLITSKAHPAPLNFQFNPSQVLLEKKLFSHT